MARRNLIKLLYRPDFQCITIGIEETYHTYDLMTIGWPQVSGRCPYKVVISQWVPARPEAKRQWERLNEYNVTSCQTVI